MRFPDYSFLFYESSVSTEYQEAVKSVMNFSLPSIDLVVGACFASIVVLIIGYFMMSMDGVNKNLLWIPFFGSYYIVMGVFTTNQFEVVQLAAITITLAYGMAILVLRWARYSNIRWHFRNYLDQPLWRALVWPRYGRGFHAGAQAGKAIHTILRVRKGNPDVANVFAGLLPDIRTLDETHNVTLGRLREVVTNSNLNISQRKFDALFSYEPSTLFNRIFHKEMSCREPDKPVVFKAGDRVLSPAYREWGIGEVLVVGDGQSIWVYFVNGGIKRLSAEYSQLQKLSGKKAKHPGLEKLNFTKAELGIPEYLGYQDYLEHSSRPALLVSKVYEDTGALSFFGGRPMLPKGFKWPRSEYCGRQQSMQFLAQIDLRSAQFDGVDWIEGLPRDGILYFFIDENTYEGDPSARMVFYVNENLDQLHPLLQADEPSAPIHHNPNYGAKFRYGTSELHDNFPTNIYPKFEFRTQRFIDIRHPYGKYAGYMFAIGRNHYLELEARVKEQQTENILNALVLIHGNEAVDKGTVNSDWCTARVLDPALIPDAMGLHDRREDESPLAERWPQTWLHVATWLGRQREFDSERGAFSRTPLAPVEKKFLSACEKMIRNAEKKGPFTLLSDSERSSIREWASNMFLHSLNVWREKKDNNEAQAAYRISSFLRYSIDYSIRRATPRCLDLEQSDRSLLNDQEKSDYWSAFENIKKDCLHQRHQMFGFGTNVQNASEDHLDKILLLQLYSDGAMSWEFGDVGAVQFWISKEDLVNRRFEKVVVTLEGG